ncbi:MAG TPA: YegS/Rv2252/BmrU family lipid kinase, partial [Candidatus Aquilonibacter sp.]|nr:YegS/Rv2252/BmrU family lipid kinase [Candidatus Aquilonibacter sp.]
QMLAQLLINEKSRRGAQAAPEVRAALSDAGIRFVEDGWPDDIGAEIECIIAAGGDGTLLGAIGNAVNRGLPLGVIPLGTFNELARTLAIPLDISSAVDVIAQGNERAIDVGRVNERYFVNESSIGISSRASRLQTTEVKRRFGFLGVIATAIDAFRRSRPMHVIVEHAGGTEQLKTIQLTIANSHRFGGFLNVADAAIDDGWLDLYSVDIESPWQAFHIARAMLEGRRHDVPGLRTLRAKRFDVRSPHAHHITADAEPAGMTPATFDVLPKALRVFVPQ